MLFGLGIVPGLISTIIFAIPAPVRLTHLGITSVPRPLLEAGEAFGATRRQLLWKVELPSARPTIFAGITQCIMLSLSMVVIAALVGAGGLGVPVVRALNPVKVGMGFEAGFAIVLARHRARPRLPPGRDGAPAMTAALEFRDVDIVFGSGSTRQRRRQHEQALRLLDDGVTRNDIAERTGAVVGVAGASLRVERGQICVLMGLSGSGKSTLLRAANGLNAVTRGSVLVQRRRDAGRHRHLRCRDLAARCAASGSPWCSSNSRCCPGARCARTSGSAWNCAACRRRRGGASSMRSCTLVGLEQWGDRYAAELSGGMQQRVGLARAFATDADILLMDEPFSALDPLIRTKLQDELLALQAAVKKTILFVSHDLDEALKLGNTISIMESGRIVQTGTPRTSCCARRTPTWPSSCST